MTIKIRLLRHDVETEQRVVTTEYDSVVQAARAIKDNMRNGVTSTLSTISEDGVAIINWATVSIAYVEPVR